MENTIILFARFTRDWHAKPRAERTELEQQHLFSLIGRYSDRLRVRFFNSIGFDPRFSHMVIITTNDPKDYYFFIEELRDSYLLAQGYLVLTRIVLGYEDGYPQFDGERQPA